MVEFVETRKFIAQVLLAMVLWVWPAEALRAAPAEVYFVVGLDTAIWNYGGTVNIYQRNSYFYPTMFAATNAEVAAFMDPNFRSAFRDSYGQPLKLTWWLMAGNIYRESLNLNVPNPNVMSLHLMKKYYGDLARQLGDELSLHYHTFVWSDYVGMGDFYWNQARDFNECREDFDVTLAHFLLEEEVFPVSFRSGWHYMDNEWQARLEEVLPFSLDNDYPVHTYWPAWQPAGNIMDWSLATSNFVPFHPAVDNYQVPGNLKGWNVRSVKLQNLTTNVVNAIFEEAANGTPQVACLWDHPPEYFSYYLGLATNMMNQAVLAHPEVKFRFCTAVEAMQRWLGKTNEIPPELTIEEVEEGLNTHFYVHSSKPLFQTQPVAAFQDIFGQSQLFTGFSTGENSWVYTLPVPSNWVAKVGFAATDPAGNLTTRILRFVTDTLYLDNLDPEYQELSGAWRPYSVAAWGRDSRVAPLAAGEVARVAWQIPVAVPGLYDLAVQQSYYYYNPSAQNPAFTLFQDGQAVFSTNFSSVVNWTWLPVVTAYLDPSHSNALEMVVQGVPGQTVVAQADVVRVLPHLLPTEDYITDLQLETADTTACIRWTTPEIATGGATYGHGYGEMSATNAAVGRQHVLTFTGLTPGTNYYFNLYSGAGGVLHSWPGTFRTTNYNYITTTSPLLGLTQSWRFTAQNMDGVKWTALNYDDSAWEGEGSALFWVDASSNGPNPLIYPKRTQLPADTNGLPSPAYYFRTHFSYTNELAGTILTVTNYLNDGAVFYLNGVEVYRAQLPAAPAVISNATPATEVAGGGEASHPVVFHLYGASLASLVQGDNVLAVEVHNSRPPSPQVVFGTSWHRRRPYAFVPRLNWLQADGLVAFYWNGEGWQLQQARQCNATEAEWQAVAGGTTSPVVIPGAEMGFFRLRKIP